ncbi:MAG TPA: translation initiation factor IF-2 [Leptolyngbyaceae cyanobacterium]
MNNGKVRIYELSRELNLDNKDILAICDQLRIPVKSHSSTISDESAERIRSVAEKYAAQHPSQNKAVSASHKPNSQTSSAQKPLAPPKKQQILGIRQHQERPAANPPKPPSAASVAIPPKAPQAGVSAGSQPTPPPTKQAAPSKPVRSPQHQEIAAKERNVQNSEGKPEPKSEYKTELKAQQGQQATVSRPAPEQLKLAEPPVRPSSTQPNLRQNNQTEQPVKKKPSKPASPQPQAEKKEQLVGKKEKDQTTSAAKPSRPAPPAPPQIPELQRPKPVIKPNAPTTVIRPAAQVEEVDAEETEDTEVLTEPQKELKRPQPPRPPKKGKSWEEEEEEQPPKVGKPAGKGKRSKQLLFDEDEVDFDDADLEVLPPTVQVSLSVARPPKPKASRAGQGASGANAGVAQPAARKKAPSRDGGAASKASRKAKEEAVPERPEKLVLTGSMTVQELAEALAVPDTEIVKRLFFKGIAVNITQSLDVPTCTSIANDFGVEVETGQKQSEASKGSEMIDAEDFEYLQRRPPVVTIMGHVDHGKTTLLDAIRESKVAQGEAGGITQHIGAYHVDVPQNDTTQQVVFLDTPGHEAFTAMRARGARVTDIAVLVVAADDGVQPQTIEAISHAKAAEVPIVVAINKIDKPDAQADRVKQELTEFGLVPEEWGGDTIMVPVSAIQKENLDTLLEMILLVAEVDEDLVANPNRAAKGTVIEANLDKSRGPVATLLVQNGTLQVGDILVAGSAFGKVRAMIDDRGSRVDAATPSFAVEVLGLNDVPAAGDEFEVFQNEKEARLLAEARAEQQRQTRLMRGRVSLTTLSAQAQEGELKELNLILKADVQGSVEAIIGALQQLPQNQVQIRILLAAPGEVTETDVDLAAASDAVIVGFNTTLASGSRQAADQAGVDVREYNIIYKLLEDIQGAMEGLLEPELVEEPLGNVEVRAVFPVGRGTVAGCYVLSGKVIRNCKVRVRRGGQVIYEGTLDSLKRMKEDTKEVNAGFECGIGIDKFNDWIVGDIIEAFKMVTKRRTLTPA